MGPEGMIGKHRSRRIARAILGPIALWAVVAAMAGCAGDGSGGSSSAPEGYVATPHGLMHHSCVGALAAGERISAGGIVLRANGERERLESCAYPRLNARTFTPIVRRPIDPTTSGWIEASYWSSASGLGFLSAVFSVPPLPVSTGGTVFFFPGAEPGDGSTILQPVLQYGSSASGGGDFWTAASWFCCPSGWTFYSSPIDVSPGDTILGTMAASCSDSGCDWDIETADISQGTSTTLTAADVTSSFTSIYGGVLEAYAVSDCSQYPDSPAITFAEVTLEDEDGNVLEPDWSTFVNDVTPQCPYGVEASATSATLSY